MGFVNEIVNDRWQTADHDRKIILNMIESSICDGHQNFRFRLFIHEKAMEFTASYEDKVHGVPVLGKDIIVDIKWNIDHMYFVDDIDMKPEQLKEIIQEALTEQGWNFQRNKAHSVKIKFDI